MALTPEQKLNRLTEKYLPKILKAMKVDFGVGSAITVQNSKIQGKQTSMSPLTMNKTTQDANVNIIETLIKDVNSDVAKKIDYIVNKNIAEQGDNRQLSKQLKELFDKDVPGHFDYKKRFETIARTESSRVLNTGANNTATRLGAKKKYLSNPFDTKTGEDSIISEEKYGSPEQAIPLDKPFKYRYKGQLREFMLPPDRPNDRSMPLYLFE